MNPTSNKGRRLRTMVSIGLSALAAVALAACGGDASGDGGGTVNLVAYSTPQVAYEEALEPAFQETPEGESIDFSNSFGGSGDQSRAVLAGQPADLVHFALETDMTNLVAEDIVAEDWNTGEHAGIVQNSVVSFLVREGNPLDIQGWDDLVREDVEVLTPNPFSSGGARWNIMAAYGSQIEQGASEEEALAFVAEVLANTSVQDKSASDALATFTGGKGDVLISYENEAIRAQQSGEAVEYVIPDETILIETPAAVPTDALNPEGGQAFLDFLLSPEGQQVFADSGYRPVDEKVLADNEDAFPTPKSLFTIEDFGGWSTVATEFFDSESGSIAEIERDLGVATG
jgi:sulfate/thiosulfate-binding protein